LENHGAGCLFGPKLPTGDGSGRHGCASQKAAVDLLPTSVRS
jgi:hypothetical protein